MSKNFSGRLCRRSRWFYSDMLSSAADDRLKDSLTDFVNLLLKGDLPVPVRQIVYGGD